MIKVAGEKLGFPFLTIGLSRGDCDRLLAGVPREVDLFQMGSTVRATVLLMAGETDEHVIEQLRKAKMINDASEFHEEIPFGLPSDPLLTGAPKLPLPPLPPGPIAAPQIRGVQGKVVKLEDTDTWESEGGQPKEQS